jgi:hypothetical protein
MNTNTVTNAIDSVYPTSNVDPLPAKTTSSSFRVSWTGSDPAGAGIAHFDVYLSTDKGPFTAWKSQTKATSAIFYGAPGHTYSFYSMATDNVGRRQRVHGKIETTTTPLPDTIAGLTVKSPKVTSGDSVTLTVQLKEDATGNGSVVQLHSSHTSILPVPASCTVRSGEKSKSLSIKAGNVSSPTNVTITASLNGSSKEIKIEVNPEKATSTVQAILPEATIAMAQTLTVTEKVAYDPAPTGTAITSRTSKSGAAKPSNE